MIRRVQTIARWMYDVNANLPKMRVFDQAWIEEMNGGPARMVSLYVDG